MAVCHEHGHLAKLRLDPNSSISISGASDFDAGRMCIIRYDFSVRELKKAGSESFYRIFRYVNTVFRDHLETRIGWRGGMPVQLCVDPARPLDDRVQADRILEGTDEDIRARGVCSADRRIHVGHKIARPL